MAQFIIPENTSRISVKDYLRYKIGLSLTTWRKVKQNGSLLINGEPGFPYTLIEPGDTITVEWTSECSIMPVNIPINIKFEDEYLLIINKPPNMLVHPTKYDETHTLANAVLYYYKQHSWSYGFHPVHRLDRNTSGLVVIAKQPFIQHLLSKNNEKNFSRIYWGITDGIITPAKGTIDAPIGRRPGSIIERMVCPNGQAAITKYRTIQQFSNATLVELELLTGRTHQIRAHLSHIGHPLLGDDLYGGSTSLISRQALHAVRILFKHPITGKTIDVSDSPPYDFQQVLKKLNF